MCLRLISAVSPAPVAVMPAHISATASTRTNVIVCCGGAVSGAFHSEPELAGAPYGWALHLILWLPALKPRLQRPLPATGLLV